MARHPYVGRPTLEWKRTAYGYEVYIVRLARYRKGDAYTTREIFAYLRHKNASETQLLPLFDTDDEGHDWLVLRHTFGDVKSFDTFKDACVHVEAMFNLEHMD